MATYQDFSLIKKEIEFIQKRNDIDLASSAFIFTILEKLYPNIELEEYITDGGQDFSIDAYYIDDFSETINIFQFKYTDNFNTSRDKAGMKDRDISDFISKIERVWSKDENLLKEANSKTAEAINEIWSAFEKGFSKTNIWFVTNYQNTLDDSKKESTQKILKEKFRANFKIFNLDDLVNLTIQKEFEPIDIKLQLKGKNYFEDSAGEIRALVSEINALNFVESIVDDENNLKEDVFNENVRVYLRSHTKINKQIYASIESEENYKFFFYNNGITAICDSFEHNKSDGPIVTLKNFQIVNGGQTIHSLYEAYKNGLREKVGDIYLLLRVYEVKNRGIGQSIARFTNTQNPVKNRDIMSNDLVQTKLQKDLKNEGWWYEAKKDEYRDQNIENEKKIDAEKLGQAILAFHLEKPGSAKNKKQEVFGDFYNDVFPESKLDTDYVLLPHLLLKEIETNIREFSRQVRDLERNKKIIELEKILIDNGFLVHSHYYLLVTLKLLAEKNSIEFKKNNKNKIFEYYEEAKKIISEIVKKNQKDPLFSMPHLFKYDDLMNDIRKLI